MSDADVKSGKKAAPLRVHSRISYDGTFNYVYGAAIHIAVWYGSMVAGPLSVICLPIAFFCLPLGLALYFVTLVGLLMKAPALPESPTFCRWFLRTAALLKNGSTLWVADDVVEHVSEGSMVCYHPHGVIPMGFSINGAVRVKSRDLAFFPEIKVEPERISGLQAPILFKIPLLRQVLQLFGCTMPATKQGMQELFKTRSTFGIVIGGSEEVALHVQGRERLFLKNRAGFIKYALQVGYKLIIAYNFGESDLYSNFQPLRPMNMWLVKNFGFVIPVFWGKWWCPLLPRSNVELNTVYGEVLQLPRIEEPTPAQVVEWHEKYMEALTRVFDRHKVQFGYAARALEIL